MNLFESLAHSLNIDCSKVINLALELQMDIKKPNIMSEIQFNCCTSQGVICTGNQAKISAINWDNLNLNGTIDSESIPSTLTSLSLVFNAISGAFPILPNGITFLDLSHNMLSGCLPNTLPFSLKYIHIHDNLLTGYLPPLLMPNLNLWLGNPNDANFNRFYGKLTLNNPSNLVIYGNYISDISIINPSGLVRKCDLSNNPLKNNPNATALDMCAQNEFYSVSLVPIFQNCPLGQQKANSNFEFSSSTTFEFSFYSKNPASSRNIQTMTFNSIIGISGIPEASEIPIHYFTQKPLLYPMTIYGFFKVFTRVIIGGSLIIHILVQVFNRNKQTLRKAKLSTLSRQWLNNEID